MCILSKKEGQNSMLTKIPFFFQMPIKTLQVPMTMGLVDVQTLEFICTVFIFESR